MDVSALKFGSCGHTKQQRHTIRRESPGDPIRDEEERVLFFVGEWLSRTVLTPKPSVRPPLLPYVVSA